MALQPPAPAPSVPPETVVLTIGDEKMTAAEFDHIVETAVPEQYRNQVRSQAGRRQFADRLVNLKVMSQEGRRLKLDETPAYKSQMELAAEQVLATQYSQHLTATTKVDEATARKYYEDHKSDYMEVKARHILIKVKAPGAPPKKDVKETAEKKDGTDAAEKKELTDEEALAKAKEIRQKLVDGADFATLAKAESDDKSNADKGGDLGTFGHGKMVPAFDKAAFSLPVGELSEPVKTQFGYHIIKVETRQEKTFTEVRADIERKLDPEAVKKAMDEVKAATPVVFNPDFFGPPAPTPAPAGTAKPPIAVQPQQPAPQPK
jgi:peptidyl-prolyl cis-trans isomerase C